MKTTTEMQLVPIAKLVPYVNNARTHSPEQITKLRSSLREFGFINPVIIDRDFNVIAGHGRILAARTAGQMSAEPPKDDMCRSISSVPTVPASPAAFAATAAARTTADSVLGTKMADLMLSGGARQAENAIAPASRRTSLKTSALTLWGWNHLTKRLFVSRLPAFISWLRISFPSASLTGILSRRHGKISERCPSIQRNENSICEK